MRSCGRSAVASLAESVLGLAPPPHRSSRPECRTTRIRSCEEKGRDRPTARRAFRPRAQNTRRAGARGERRLRAPEFHRFSVACWKAAGARAWARRAVGEGVKSCPRAGCGKSACPAVRALPPQLEVRRFPERRLHAVRGASESFGIQSRRLGRCPQGSFEGAR